MSNKKLLPCPFCGGEAIYEIDEKDEIVDKIPALFCNVCKFTFTVENDSPYMEDEKTYEYLKEKTIKAWNTRVPTQKIVERLEDINMTAVDLANLTCSTYQDGVVSGIERSLEIIREEGGLDV